ncbi:hypothetical protein IJG78_02175 [Candidatus Saccharibacteria bacterium]|nr:hypothetical protein [Candidatus Saccharibacteria bacterium]
MDKEKMENKNYSEMPTTSGNLSRMALLADEMPGDNSEVDSVNNTTETGAETDKIATPSWKQYVNTFSDQEIIDGVKPNGEEFDISKLDKKAEEFGVNSDDYPIFNRQTVEDDDGKPVRWNIDRILSEYLTFTAATIEQMDGTDGPKIDHVIYLDKSARPVSWIVNKMWGDFAKKDADTGEPTKRPEESFLNIDRVPWMRRVGLNVNKDMYMEDPSGAKVKVGFNEFVRATKKDLPIEDIAAIRALYDPDGRTTDDPTEIMMKPSPMAGKNILIIDEVADTGTTQEITKWLVEQAFPDAKSVKSYVFANFGTRRSINERGQVTEAQMRSAPVWYPANNHDWEYGRGVLDLNPGYWKNKYENDPTPQNYAKMKADMVLSEPMEDLSAEPGGESLELMREIDLLKDAFDAGKVFAPPKGTMDPDKAFLMLARQGVNPRNAGKIMEEISARKADNYYSKEFPPH